MSTHEKNPDVMHLLTQPGAWDRVASGYVSAVMEHLEKYARDALQLAKVTEAEDVLDVATGPGTLARQAARITSVHATDFSQKMLEELRKNATPDELEQLILQQADGQALPYKDASFDAAFSMFGLFLFPDRSQGFSELARVLRPGGRAVVSSWHSQDDIPAFRIMSEELSHMLSLPTSGKPPLSDADACRSEMSTAGFEVTLHERVHVLSCPSLDALWEGFLHAHVMLGVAKAHCAQADYEQLLKKIYTRLKKELGDGPQELPMSAWLALGYRSQ